MSDNDTASYGLSGLLGGIGLGGIGLGPTGAAVLQQYDNDDERHEHHLKQQLLQQYARSQSLDDLVVRPQQRALAASGPAVEDEKAWLRRRVREVLWTP